MTTFVPTAKSASGRLQKITVKVMLQLLNVFKNDLTMRVRANFLQGFPNPVRVFQMVFS